jgi:hypothetical protein
MNFTKGSYYKSIIDKKTVNIIDIGGLSATSLVNTNPLCFGNANGSIDVTITGGTANYTIGWGIGNTTSASSNYTITGLLDGAYNITVTDINDAPITDDQNTTKIEGSTVIISTVGLTVPP